MPSKNHGRRSAHRAHSPLRLSSYWSKLLHFTRAKTMRRTQSSELSGAYYTTKPSQRTKLCDFLRAAIQASVFSSVERAEQPLPHTSISRRNVTREFRKDCDARHAPPECRNIAKTSTASPKNTTISTINPITNVISAPMATFRQRFRQRIARASSSTEE